MSAPNPGSPEAVALGCSCPRIDNGHGRGRGDGLFWLTEGCPLHAPEGLPDPSSTPNAGESE